jgi:hypothetical protein
MHIDFLVIVLLVGLVFAPIGLLSGWRSRNKADDANVGFIMFISIVIGAGGAMVLSSGNIYVPNAALVIAGMALDVAVLLFTSACGLYLGGNTISSKSKKSEKTE